MAIVGRATLHTATGRKDSAMMQTLNLVLFTALIVGFLVLFLAPGRWWPRRPFREHREHRDTPIPHDPLPLQSQHDRDNDELN